jgi:hypothetical protein
MVFSIHSKLPIQLTQPRPQGLPRGGARAEEDPGKINKIR